MSKGVLSVCPSLAFEFSVVQPNRADLKFNFIKMFSQKVCAASFQLALPTEERCAAIFVFYVGFILIIVVYDLKVCSFFPRGFLCYSKAFCSEAYVEARNKNNCGFFLSFLAV